jgi:hypothetical protein
VGRRQTRKLKSSYIFVSHRSTKSLDCTERLCREIISYYDHKRHSCPPGELDRSKQRGCATQSRRALTMSSTPSENGSALPLRPSLRDPDDPVSPRSGPTKGKTFPQHATTVYSPRLQKCYFPSSLSLLIVIFPPSTKTSFVFISLELS